MTIITLEGFPGNLKTDREVQNPSTKTTAKARQGLGQVKLTAFVLMLKAHLPFHMRWQSVLTGSINTGRRNFKVVKMLISPERIIKIAITVMIRTPRNSTGCNNREAM